VSDPSDRDQSDQAGREPDGPAIVVSEPSPPSIEKAMTERAPRASTYRYPSPSDTSRSTGPVPVAPVAPSPTSDTAPLEAIVYWLTLAVPAFAVYATRPSSVTTSQHAAAWLFVTDALITSSVPSPSTVVKRALAVHCRKRTRRSPAPPRRTAGRRG
jgi:hypothetical protein